MIQDPFFPSSSLLTEHIVPKSGDLGRDFGPFLLVFLFYSKIEESFNEANNRVSTDLLGQILLHLTVMNFAQ